MEADADDVLEDAEFEGHVTGYAAAISVGLGDVWVRIRWARLIDAAASEGVALAPAEPESAPFEVEFTDRLVAERER